MDDSIWFYNLQWMYYDNLVLDVNGEILKVFVVSIYDDFDAYFSYRMMIEERYQMNRLNVFQYQMDKNLYEKEDFGYLVFFDMLLGCRIFDYEKSRK
jgi:hypothetical protein